jgi:hypothetical protein
MPVDWSQSGASYKRLSTGRFRFWPVGGESAAGTRLAAHQLHVLLSGGDPEAARGATEWRRVSPG